MLPFFAYLAEAHAGIAASVMALPAPLVQGLLLALAAALVYGFLGISFEIAGKRRYPVWDVMLIKQSTGFLIGVFCTLILKVPLFDPRLLLLGAIGAVSYVLTLSAYLRASRERNIASNWTIVNLSVAMPILISVLFLGDTFTTLKLAGVGLTLVSIILIGRTSGEGTRTSGSHWLFFISVAFLLNGVLVILFRFVPQGREALFTVYFYGLSVCLILIYKAIANRSFQVNRGLAGVSVLGAATHWSGIMLTMAALSSVSKVSRQTGVIVYPVTNGLVIPVGVVLGALLLKQHISRRVGLGVSIGVVALICLFLP
jgi:drug/metabolite transporter (DMT)-like permease